MPRGNLGPVAEAVQYRWHPTLIASANKRAELGAAALWGLPPNAMVTHGTRCHLLEVKRRLETGLRYLVTRYLSFSIGIGLCLVSVLKFVLQTEE